MITAVLKLANSVVVSESEIKAKAISALLKLFAVPDELDAPKKKLNALCVV